MKIVPKNSVKKFQEGGAVEQAAPVTQEAPAMGAEGAAALQLESAELDPIVILAQMSALALLNLDCQMAMQVCLAFIQLILLTQGGAPQEPQGEPVFRKGGILVRRIKK